MSRHIFGFILLLFCVRFLVNQPFFNPLWFHQIDSHKVLHLCRIHVVCDVYVASVVIQSYANIPPLDEETILFFKDRVVLGKVTKFFYDLCCTSLCCGYWLLLKCLQNDMYKF